MAGYAVLKTKSKCRSVCNPSAGNKGSDVEKIMMRSASCEDANPSRPCMAVLGKGYMDHYDELGCPKYYKSRSQKSLASESTGGRERQ